MGRLLWKPTAEQIKATHMYRFMTTVNERFGADFSQYEDLYDWSVQHIPDFWATLWDFADIRATSGYTQVLDDVNKMPGATWNNSSSRRSRWASHSRRRSGRRSAARGER